MRPQRVGLVPSLASDIDRSLRLSLKQILVLFTFPSFLSYVEIRFRGDAVFVQIEDTEL